MSIIFTVLNNCWPLITLPNLLFLSPMVMFLQALKNGSEASVDITDVDTRAS